MSVDAQLLTSSQKFGENLIEDNKYGKISNFLFIFHLFKIRKQSVIASVVKEVANTVKEGNVFQEKEFHYGRARVSNER